MTDDFAEFLNSQLEQGPVRGRARAWALILPDLLVSIPSEYKRAWRTVRAEYPRSSRFKPSGVTMVHDIRLAVRTLRKQPGYALTVIGTLALGIGANVAMFSVIDGVLARPLPYDSPDRMALIWNRHVNTGADKVQISGPDFLDYSKRASQVEEFAAIHNAFDNTLIGEQDAEQIDVAVVSRNFFSFLGRTPLLGRGFVGTRQGNVTKFDNDVNSVVISYGLWARRFGSDPSIQGRVIQIGQSSLEIIGVMPSGFELIMPDHDGGTVGGGAFDEIDAWRTFPDSWFNSGRGMGMFRVLGRLEEGVSFELAQQEMNAIAAQLRDEHTIHEERGVRIDVFPMHADVVGKVQPVILTLFGAVGFVLLIACANVANLSVIRGAGRRREVAVRAALGATRGHIVRQLLAEASLLAILGGVLGLIFASGAIEVIKAIAPADVPRIAEIGIGGPVLAFTAGACALVIVLFGLAPSLGAAKPDLRTVLTEVSRTSSGRGARMRNAVVIGEIALSLTLLIGGGLMFRTFVHLQRANLGFDAASTITMKVILPRNVYGGPDFVETRNQYFESLRRGVTDLPNVEAAGFVWPLPFAGRGADVPYAATNETSIEWGRHVATFSWATAGFFEAMGTEVVSGRVFTEQDTREARQVAVVDELIATELFPGSEATGRTIWVGSPGSSVRQSAEIIGVVKHIRHEGVVGEERPTIYAPASGSNGMALVVRTTGDPEAPLDDVRGVAHALDPNVPLFDIRTFTDYVSEEIAPTRFALTLAGVFAGLALILATVGLYGVIAYSVAQRTRELGVRVALGAGRERIIRHVLGQGMTVAALGVLVGIGASLAVTRLLGGMLHGVTPHDPTTFVAVSVLLLGVAMFASYLPARRATLVDPVNALRTD